MFFSNVEYYITVLNMMDQWFLFRDRDLWELFFNTYVTNFKYNLWYVCCIFILTYKMSLAISLEIQILSCNTCITILLEWRQGYNHKILV